MELFLKILCCLVIITLGILIFLSAIDFEAIRRKKIYKKEKRKFYEQYKSLTRQEKEMLELILNNTRQFEICRQYMKFLNQLKPIPSEEQLIEQPELSIKSAANLAGYETALKYVDDKNRCCFVVAPKKELLQYELIVGPIPNITTIDHNEPFR